MKKRFTILAVTCIFFAACQKDSSAPEPVATGTTKKTTSSVTTSTPVAAANDTTKGYLRLQLAKDSTNTDDILVEFNPASKASFVSTEDAHAFAGFGQESLSSLSSDGVSLAINTLPLWSKGTTVALSVSAKATGTYRLNLTTISSVPAAFDIYLKDNLKNDSLDFRKYPSYAFNLVVTDNATFGSKRFSLVLRQH